MDNVDNRVPIKAEHIKVVRKSKLGPAFLLGMRSSFYKSDSKRVGVWFVWWGGGKNDLSVSIKLAPFFELF